MPGPIPRREETLARPRARKGGDQQAVKKGVLRDVTFDLEPEENWHPIAKAIWESTLDSGQADFYQNSDLAILYSLCDDIDHYKRSYKRSGQMLQTIMSALERLLVTEGDRRRVRLELHAPEPEVELASVTAIHEYERDLDV